MKNNFTKLLLPLLALLIIIPIAFSLFGNDTGHLLGWWFGIFILGLIFLPLSTRIFKKFFDKGYILSKVLGLALSTMTIWLLASLRMVPFRNYTVYIILAIAFILIYVIFKGYKDFIESIKENVLEKQTFIYMEIMFLVLLIIAAFIKGHNPATGIEMPMDFAFLNSIMRTDYFPPYDVWMSSVPNNYYYYGQFVFAFLTKLSAGDSLYTYNLAFASLFPFAFTLCFSLTASLIVNIKNLKKKVLKAVVAGLIASCLLTIGGNLHTTVYRDILRPLNKAGIIVSTDKNHTFGDLTTDYYFTGPRSYIGYEPEVYDENGTLLPDTKLITEMPSYSLILGDLHAQINNILFVLLFISLLYAFALFVKEKSDKKNTVTERTKKKKGKAEFIEEVKEETFVDMIKSFPLHIILMSIVLPVMFMTNTWDFPIYLVVMSITFLFTYLHCYKTVGKAFINALIDMIKVLVISLILIIPFFVHFKNPTLGTHFTQLGHYTLLYFFQQFVLWGLDILFVVTFIVFMIKRYKKKKESNSAKAPVMKKFRSFFTRMEVSDLMIFILACCAIGLILVSELVYQKDVSGADYSRANTVFKLYLQSFIMLDIVTGYTFVRVVTNFDFKKVSHFIITPILVICIILPFNYTGELLKYYQNPSKVENYVSLNVIKDAGSRYNYTAISRAIMWLRDNVEGQAVIAEAAGSDGAGVDGVTFRFGNSARFSTATGLQTIIGWHGHQQYWRGSAPEVGTELTTRTDDVRTLYNATNAGEALAIIDKYDIEYIIISEIEQLTYPEMNVELLKSLGTVVFNSGDGTLIIKIER